MKNTINKIFLILPKKYFSGLLLILIMTLLISTFEVFSIALIIPLLSNFTDNNEYFILNYFPIFQKYNSNQILALIIFLFLFIFFLKNILLIFFNMIKSKFSHKLFIDLSNKMLKIYLNKDYSFFIKNNSSELIRNVSIECSILTFGVVSVFINLISDLIIVFSICLFLLFYNFYASTFIIMFIFVISFVLLKFTNKKFKHWGTIRHKYSSKIYQNLQEIFGYIKEIILSGSHNYFLKQYSSFNTVNSNASINRDVYSVLPRPFLETIALLCFSILILILLFSGIERSEILILIGTIFFSSIKLLPLVSNIIKSLQNIKYNFSSVKIIYHELNKVNINSKKTDLVKINKNFFIVKFHNIFFSYDKKKNIINNLSFEIKKNDKIGIMGKSGSGKTTFLNLFTGLLSCTVGEITVDDMNITTISNQWKRKIGYVHQNIFLADDTILFNIALKKTLSKIELLKMWKILRIVEMDKYITSLDFGLYTIVGERGSRLSGGQSQRLGLARALFFDPSIIILDEATSGLDEKTQERILKYIYNMKNKTVIAVSHRINALKYCDKIFSFKNGQLLKY